MAEFTVKVRKMTDEQKIYNKIQETQFCLNHIENRTVFLYGTLMSLREREMTEENLQAMRSSVIRNVNDIKAVITCLEENWK